MFSKRSHVKLTPNSQKRLQDVPKNGNLLQITSIQVTGFKLVTFHLESQIFRPKYDQSSVTKIEILIHKFQVFFRMRKALYVQKHPVFKRLEQKRVLPTIIFENNKRTKYQILSPEGTVL